MFVFSISTLTCTLERGGAPDRVKAHLLGLEGFGIAKCPKIPPVDVARMEPEAAGLPLPSKRKATTCGSSISAALGAPPTNAGRSFFPHL